VGVCSATPRSTQRELERDTFNLQPPRCFHLGSGAVLDHKAMLDVSGDVATCTTLPLILDPRSDVAEARLCHGIMRVVLLNVTTCNLVTASEPVFLLAVSPRGVATEITT
jgi:hypothetical protein